MLVVRFHLAGKQTNPNMSRLRFADRPADAAWLAAEKPQKAVVVKSRLALSHGVMTHQPTNATISSARPVNSNAPTAISRSLEWKVIANLPSRRLIGDHVFGKPFHRIQERIEKIDCDAIGLANVD